MVIVAGAGLSSAGCDLFEGLKVLCEFGARDLSLREPILWQIQLHLLLLHLAG